MQDTADCRKCTGDRKGRPVDCRLQKRFSHITIELFNSQENSIFAGS
jgi:hypothetical protein